MKATELRIENYIKLFRRPEDEKMTIHKIVSILWTTTLGYAILTKDGFTVNTNKGIEPIPLTEESMINLGLEYIDDNV